MMPAFLSGFEVKFSASKRKVKKYLSTAPFYEVYVDGKLAGRGPLRGVPMYYRALSGWKRIDEAMQRISPTYGIGNGFMLSLDPPPDFKVEVEWRLQLLGGKRFKQYITRSTAGEVAHV